jgi:DNA polymerase III delta prime subunit
MIEIHKNIKRKLLKYIKNNKIPHIILHGKSGSGKKTLLWFFLKQIYKNYTVNEMNNYIMYINCITSKGIRFFREELKFFAKTNILKKKDVFKSIILLNADQLTMDTQSALRRCIEKYSHTTRFFIIIENKEKLLKPILSRFCDIFVPFPLIGSKRVNLHSLKKNKIPINNLKKKIKNNKIQNLKDCLQMTEKLYINAYNSLDIMKYIKKMDIEETQKYFYLSYFEKIRGEYRNEKLLMFSMLYFIFLRNDLNLENIENM